jgi:hypothetical protein
VIFGRSFASAAHPAFPPFYPERFTRRAVSLHFVRHYKKRASANLLFCYSCGTPHAQTPCFDILTQNRGWHPPFPPLLNHYFNSEANYARFLFRGSGLQPRHKVPKYDRILPLRIPAVFCRRAQILRRFGLLRIRLTPGSRNTDYGTRDNSVPPRPLFAVLYLFRLFRKDRPSWGTCPSLTLLPAANRA